MEQERMKHLTRWTRLTGLLLAGALVATGCADSSTDEGSKAGELDKSEIYTTGLLRQADAGTPVQGGVLTVAEYSEARTLDPSQGYANGSVGGSALAAVYDALMRYDFKDRSWKPKLAESLTSDDNVTWTLKLREGVKFADGTPYDADAVIGSLSHYMKKYGYQSTTMLANQTKMKKIDDRTVEFTNAGPWATFPAMLAGGPGMIMAPSSYKDPKAFKPVGAGPFELEAYKPGEELVLKSRADYWDGKPHLEKLRFVWLGADDAKLESLKSGGVDAAYIRSAQTTEQAIKDGSGGMMFVVGAGSQITVNMRKDRPGADKRVRQAIQLAFDNKAYAERALQGAGLPSKSLFADSSPWSTGVKYPEVDREAAKKLVTETKADGWDGKVSYLAGGDPASQQAAVQVEAQLEAVGFDVTIEGSANIADGTKRLYIDHDFDLALSAANVGDADPYSSLYEVYASTGTTNLTGYANPEMDKLLAELRENGADPAAAKKALTGIETLIRDDVPVVQVTPSGNFLPWSKNVHGIVPTVQEMVFYDKAWKQQ
jgi:peptide/nickel transport system substrate-binding protein